MADDPHVIDLVAEAPAAAVADTILMWSEHADAAQVSHLLSRSLRRHHWGNTHTEVEALLLLCAARPDVASELARSADPRLVLAAAAVPLPADALDVALWTLMASPLPTAWPWSRLVVDTTVGLCYGGWTTKAQRAAAAELPVPLPSPESTGRGTNHHRVPLVALSPAECAVVAANVSRAGSSPVRPSTHWAATALVLTHGATLFGGDTKRVSLLVNRCSSLSREARRAVIHLVAGGSGGSLRIGTAPPHPKGARQADNPATIRAAQALAATRQVPHSTPLRLLASIYLPYNTSPWWATDLDRTGADAATLRADHLAGRYLLASAVAAVLGDDPARWQIAAAVASSLTRDGTVNDLAGVVDALSA